MQDLIANVYQFQKNFALYILTSYGFELKLQLPGRVRGNRKKKKNFEKHWNKVIIMNLIVSKYVSMML